MRACILIKHEENASGGATVSTPSLKILTKYDVTQLRGGGALA
jgi:hypothetical protein